MSDFNKLMEFLEKNAGEEASLKTESIIKPVYEKVFNLISELALYFGLDNSTAKQGGGLSIGTRRGRQFKKYLWFKLTCEEEKKYPVNIGIFIFNDHMDVSLQLTNSSSTAEDLENYKIYYNEPINKRLSYLINDDDDLILDTKKYPNANLSEFSDGNDMECPVKNQKEPYEGNVGKIVPKYIIESKDKSDEAIIKELNKGIECILPLYKSIILSKNVSEDDFGIKLHENFDFSSSGNQMPKSKKMSKIVIPPKVTSDMHYKIQKKLFEDLKEKYDGNINIEIGPEVKINECRADLILRNKNDYEIYEVKPYERSRDCIRESVGQLLEYKFRLESMDKNIQVKKLIVVGPAPNDEYAKKFIEFLNSKSQLFEYQQSSLFKSN